MSQKHKMKRNGPVMATNASGNKNLPVNLYSGRVASEWNEKPKAQGGSVYRGPWEATGLYGTKLSGLIH